MTIVSSPTICFHGAGAKSATTTIIPAIDNQPSAGDLIIVSVAADNTGTGAASTCSMSGTGVTAWNAFPENPIITPGLGAASGAVLYLFWAKATGSLAAVTVSFGTAVTAKVCSAMYFRSDAAGFGTVLADWRISFASDAGPAPAAISFTVADKQAWFGATADEGLTSDVTRFHSTVDAFQATGTTGGGGASNMTAVADASACSSGGSAPTNETPGTYSFTNLPAGDAAMAVLVIAEAVVLTPSFPDRRRTSRPKMRSLLVR